MEFGMNCGNCGQTIPILESGTQMTQEDEMVLTCPHCLSMWVVHKIQFQVEFVGKQGECND